MGSWSNSPDSGNLFFWPTCPFLSGLKLGMGWGWGVCKIKWDCASLVLITIMCWWNFFRICCLPVTLFHGTFTSLSKWVDTEIIILWLNRNEKLLTIWGVQTSSALTTDVHITNNNSNNIMLYSKKNSYNLIHLTYYLLFHIIVNLLIICVCVYKRGREETQRRLNNLKLVKEDVIYLLDILGVDCNFSVHFLEFFIHFNAFLHLQKEQKHSNKKPGWSKFALLLYKETFLFVSSWF